MIVKDLYDPVVKQELLDRIEKLSPQSQRVWGKMSVAQMLTHLQRPIEVAYGTRTVRGNLMMRLVFPLFKKMLYDHRPYPKGMPSDKTFVVKDDRDFEKEKARLVELIRNFSPDTVTLEVHPIFGKLSKDNWSKATWKHVDHHLQQFGV